MHYVNVPKKASEAHAQCVVVHDVHSRKHINKASTCTPCSRTLFNVQVIPNMFDRYRPDSLKMKAENLRYILLIHNAHKNINN